MLNGKLANQHSTFRNISNQDVLYWINNTLVNELSTDIFNFNNNTLDTNAWVKITDHSSTVAVGRRLVQHTIRDNDIKIYKNMNDELLALIQQCDIELDSDYTKVLQLL